MSFGHYVTITDEHIGKSSGTESRESVDESERLYNTGINRKRIASYDEAFSKAGFGLWQWMLLIQCGWANASDAIEIMCISFIITPIKDTMNVSYAGMSGLTLSLFLGMMVGGYIWGSIADTYGRRRTVCVSLFINAFFGILSAFSQYYWLLLLMRFCSGIGAGGSLPICFTYFSEFQPVKYRGAMISALAMCWMVGNLIVGFLALGILPNSETIALLSPYGNQWRLFVIVCAIPSLTSALLFYLLPESPKFLYTSNRQNETLVVLRTMHEWNNWRKKLSSFDVDGLISNQYGNDEQCLHLLQEDDGSNLPASSRIGLQSYTTSLVVVKSFRIWKSQMTQIFAPIRRTQTITITTLSGLIAFCGYGVAMWTPVLLEKTETYGGSPCRSHTGNDTIGEGVSNKSTNLYVDILVGLLAQLPGNITFIVLMDRVGAKVLLIVSSFLSSVSILFFWLVDSKSSVVATNGVFNAISVGLWNSVDVLLVEMYPTNIRSIATGNACASSRLGSIMGSTVFGLFMDVDCSVPILAVFFVYIICGMLSFKLPNTRSIALE